MRSRLPDQEVRWLDNEGNVQVEKSTTKSKVKERSTATPLMPISSPPRLYLFGINRKRLQQVAAEIHQTLNITERLNEANLLVTPKSYYRRRPQRIRDAENSSLPVYVLKSHTTMQLRQFLATVFPTAIPNQKQPDSIRLALNEVAQAINQVNGNSQKVVKLSPQGAYIRRLQHLTVERSDLSSRSSGREPERRVTIFQDEGAN